MIGKECFYLDRVTHSKKFNDKSLGVCVKEGTHSVNGLPIVWFEKAFLGFCYQYKKDVRL
jgi:hypothetical protein